MKNILILSVIIISIGCIAAVKDKNKAKTPVTKGAYLGKGVYKRDSLEDAQWRAREDSSNRASMATLRTDHIESLPLTLDLSNMDIPFRKEQNDKDIAITELIAGPDLGLFSREPMSTFEYVSTLVVKPQYTVFLIRSLRSYGDNKYPMYYHLLSVDSIGKMLDKAGIATMYSPLHIETSIIYSDLTIESKYLDLTWEKDPKESGYENNKVVKSDMTGIRNFKISDKGEIALTRQKDYAVKGTAKN